ncbi:MAG TPA: geranylgeranylglycerol-phosphate geranylgeranyltransferase [Chitinophagaceae bacterium]|nr:geranylgeranylglycerol-phosphate geranylgeranyltransferase [Chitinophagaceae bacterium]HPH32507.1 geranylgeranylglycerol-phosphate geranylgeranyltransferase [Chitinophagaceae bacterium]
MRFTAALLKLIRLPNLFFIALTQVLFYYAVVVPVLHQVLQQPAFNDVHFFLLVASSVLIAAAGYIINDYFDINIDEVNKPRKNVVDQVISRRWAMLLHFVFSGLGLLLSLYLSWKTGYWYIVITNFLCIGLLFGYSVSLKRKLLSGNILISLLTAWVILIITTSEGFYLYYTQVDNGVLEAHRKIVRIGNLYAGFAFISSLIREAIKDMEDMEGDAKYGCRTMPIVWGINTSKVYVGVWLVVLIAILVIVQFYVLQFRWWMPVTYSFVLIIAPMIYIFYKLFGATRPADFHHLSRWIKTVMLTGILSMIFFYFFL